MIEEMPVPKPPDEMNEEEAQGAMEAIGRAMADIGAGVSREEAIAKHGLNTDQIDTMDSFFKPEGRGSNAGSRVDEGEMDIQARRRLARQELIGRFGRPKYIGNTQARGWYDVSDDSMWVVAPDASQMRIGTGGLYNAGDRHNPIWKKWLGKDGGGWVDATPAENITPAPQVTPAEPPQPPQQPPQAQRPQAQAPKQPASTALAPSSAQPSRSFWGYGSVAGGAAGATMGGNMILEEYSKRVREDGATGHEAGPTLSQMQNAEDNELLAEMLDKRGDEGKALAQKLIHPETTSKDDLINLMKARAELVENMNTAKEMGDVLSPNAMQGIADAMPDDKDNPGFRQLFGTGGGEGLSRLFRNKLRTMWLREPDRFLEIKKTIDEEKKYRNGEYRKRDEEIAAIAKEHGFSPDKFVGIMSNSDQKERVQLLRDEIQKSSGFFGRLFAGVEARRLERSVKMRMDDAIAQLNERKKAIGEKLGLAILDSDEVREAFMREAADAKKPEAPVLGMKEARVLMPRVEDAVDAWNKRKRERPDTDFDTWHNEYMQEQTKAFEDTGKVGFLRKLCLAILESFFKDKAKFGIT